MMSERFSVEVDRKIVGIAVRGAQGFRFFSCDPAYLPLERRIFKHARDVERTVASFKQMSEHSNVTKKQILGESIGPAMI